MDPEVASLGEVLAQQSVGVLVRTALPRATVMSRDITDRFSQDIADTNRGADPEVGLFLDIGEWCRW